MAQLSPVLCFQNLRDAWFVPSAHTNQRQATDHAAHLMVQKTAGFGLNYDMLAFAAQALVGPHDFTTFRSVHCQSDSPVKTLDRLDVEQVATPMGTEVRVHAEARSFLHHQVRSMVGCLALVGMGRWPEERMAEALAARDRQELGLNAPPHGLYFVSASYPADS